MDTWEVKIVCMVIMYVVIFVSMLLPIKAKKIIDAREDGREIVSILRCFAGGIFLGTILTHMLPEVNFLITPAFLEKNKVDYPIGEVFVLLGFFFICFFERSIITFDRWKRSKRRSTKTGHSDSAHHVQGSYTNDAYQGNELPAEAVASVKDEKSDPEKAEKVEKRGEEGSKTQEAKDIAEIRSIVFYLALSFECVFDGLSVGLQYTVSGTWNMCIAVIAHEFIIAFCIGMELLKYHPPPRIVVAAFGYAIIPPIGCGVGMILTETNLEVHQDVLDTTSGLLIAIAAGIFLSCTFIGMLGEELIEEGTFQKLFAAVFGVAIMAGLASIVPHEKKENGDITLSTVGPITTITDV